MKKRPSLALALVFSLFTSALSQNPKPAPSPQTPPQQQEQDDNDVVRITTNLVQVDAVITDKNGKLVTDLRPEEIEILEDGRPQKIANFSFVSTDSAASQPASPPAPADKLAPPVPPARLRPDQVRRTVALVVDDLGLSFESTAYVRQALKKFVDQQLQPGDLVAIIRTAGGVGALQQFTSDKRQLYAAIERVRWNPQGRGGVGAFAPIQADPMAQMREQNANQEENDSRSEGTDIDQFREELFAVGTLGALNYVVRGMRELPGRKSILLMSDGIKIFNRDDPTRSSRVLDNLRRLTDLANRASVVIYTMDARGLQTLGLTAADSTSGLTGDELESQLEDRRSDFFESQNGLNYLARQTGGFPIRNSNDLSAGIKRVLEDQKGYYLIGYRPEESTFDTATGRRKFHKITLKLKRPGLSHRTRTGFYGITDQEAAPRPRTRAQQLTNALTSPFGSGGVKLRLTSLYGNDPKAGGFVRSLIHIEARDLTFTDEPDGWHKAVFDVLAVTFGDNGTVLDEMSRTHTVRARGGAYQRALEHGLVYVLTVPIKKPGAYQLRAALRDAGSERVGSASQFIEVPNIGKNRLTLSGIIISGRDPSPKPAATAVNKAPASPEPIAPGAQGEKAEEETSELDPQAGAAVRKFRRGMVMSYAYVVYNVMLDKATGRPQTQAQMRLFRDGKEVFTGRVVPLDGSGQLDLKRLTAGGALQIGTEMTPGEYILQVIVTDPLAKEKYRTTTQWIDFEIVK
ncbi:MAG: VWA domain-containing protein [Acidobacteria bacterium]|nr:VWA domain-containing protein [Acidobacteriota bacterium]